MDSIIIKYKANSHLVLAYKEGKKKQKHVKAHEDV